MGVLTATVNTFLELARKNARNYLPLVPQLYHILVNTTNNWLSIKLLKVFQLLCPLEPRLPAKMVEPLTNLLNTTKARSGERGDLCGEMMFEKSLTAMVKGIR